MKQIRIAILLSFAGLFVFGQNNIIRPGSLETELPGFDIFPDSGLISSDSAEISNALLFFESRISDLKEKEGRSNQARILFCRAEVDRLKGNYKDAVDHLLGSYNRIKFNISDHDKARLQSRICLNYIGILKLKYQPDSMSMALRLLGYDNFEEMSEETVLQFEELKDEENTLTLLGALFDYFQLINKPDKAYYYGNKLIRFKDYLTKQEVKRELAELKSSYNMAQKEIEVNLLNNQKLIYEERIKTRSTQQWIIIGGIGLLLIFTFGLGHRLRAIRKTKDLLQKKAAQLQHEKNRAEKNEKFKEQFLANVSHEIRTPMNAISGITNILIKNKHPEFQEKYLAAMNESAKNLLILINDILDLSKLEAGKMELVMEAFYPRKVINEVFDILRTKAERKGLDFHVFIDEDVPDGLLGDGLILRNILMNLVENAISFTESGEVKINCEVQSKEEEMFILRFAVKDTGMGIVPEKQEKILKTFVKVYDNESIQYQGSGLELAIINQLVELQRGTIWLESEPGKGTTFYTDLPYYLPDHGVASYMKEEEFENVDLTGISVLLVEDNEFNVMVATSELESFIPDIKIDVAENGQIALDLIQKNNYNIILMDVQMPVMDGYEATRAIRKMGGKLSKLPVIAMTANVLQQEIDKCYREGMNDYISKPFDTNELLKKIGSLVINSN